MGDHSSRSTFSQLAEPEISSKRLYLWSAPIDLIERYQFYLNQPPPPIKTSLGTQFFYNCTWPQIGPFCKYSFDFERDEKSFSSLSEFIEDFYFNHEYAPETLTCYVHLKYIVVLPRRVSIGI